MKRISPFIVKKLGNWDEAINFFKKSGYRVKTESLKAQEDICKDFRDRVINHILAQDLNWPPLSEYTKEHKKNPNNSEMILMDTELYIKSITAYRVGNTYYAGIKKGIAYHRRGSFVNVDRVAALNETGTTRVPARPLWEPTLLELGGAKGIRDYIANRIYKKLLAQSKNSPITITKGKILSKITK